MRGMFIVYEAEYQSEKVWGKNSQDEEKGKWRVCVYSVSMFTRIVCDCECALVRSVRIFTFT